MNKRPLLLACWLFGLADMAFAAQPNILFLFADDQSYETIRGVQDKKVAN